MADDTHVYVGVHGYPLVSGYICEFNQSCAKEEDLRTSKKRKTGEVDCSKSIDSSAIPMYLWSSPSFQLFMSSAGQEKDQFDVFIDPEAPTMQTTTACRSAARHSASRKARSGTS